jgi:hypothetical protein
MSRCGSLRPQWGGVCSPGQRLPRVAPPNPPDPARVCLAGGRVVCDDGWLDQGQSWLLDHWAERRTIASLARRGGGPGIGRIDAVHNGRRWRSRAGGTPWVGGVFCTIMVPGGRSPNGTVDHRPHRPTLENHVNRSRVAHGERASAQVLWARCRPGYELAAKGRRSDSQRR